MTLEDKVYAASSRFHGKSKTKTFEPGRVCSNEDCNVTISIYNPNDTCHAHTPLKVPRLRGEYIRKGA